MKEYNNYTTAIQQFKFNNLLNLKNKLHNTTMQIVRLGTKLCPTFKNKQLVPICNIQFPNFLQVSKDLLKTSEGRGKNLLHVLLHLRHFSVVGVHEVLLVQHGHLPFQLAL